MLEKAQSDAFWGPFSLLGQLSQPTCTLLQEWVIAKVNNGTPTDIEAEGPELARQFCIGLLTLLSYASPNATQEQNAGIDIALIIMDTICTETPEYLQVFRDYAQEAYLEAKKNPLYLAQLLQAKRYLEAEKAKEDAFKTEVQLSYHRQSQTSPSQGSSPAFAFDGEIDGQPLTFPAKDLSQYGHIHDNNMYTSLHQLLNLHGAAPFQQRKAVRIICTLLSQNVHENHPIHQYIFNFLTSSLPHTMGNGTISLLDGLRILLTNKKLHYTFITHNGIKVLKHILTTTDSRANNVQALYFAGYCMWLLSYNPDNDCYIEQWSMVETLVSLLRTITRDKIVRISLLTFVNLLPRRDFVTLFIGAQLHKLIAVIQQRKWADKDVIADLNTLQQALAQRLADLSTFDQYLAEVRSGSLKKTPVHCERFWRDNASKFDTADPSEEYLRKIISFVTSPETSTECLEMAAYDLGEFARFHPDGKKILARLGAKIPLMELMKNPDQAVSKAALLATQKLLIHRWDEMLQANKAQGLKA